VSTPLDVNAIRNAPTVDGPNAAVAGHAPLAPPGDPSDEALDELSELADRSPEDVAQILQSWLADETVSS
jgi:flagellar biosynthesis/type III secretory pathway M-ring protein FliF/YscJ